jgi:hypothetical protein
MPARHTLTQERLSGFFRLVLACLLSVGAAVPSAQAQPSECQQPSEVGCPVAAHDLAWAVLGNADEVHSWRLQLGQGGHLRVVLGNLDADYDLHVYRGDGTLVSESTNEATDDDAVDLDGLGAGTYFIYINSARSQASTSAYSLSVDFEPALVAAAPALVEPTPTLPPPPAPAATPTPVVGTQSTGANALDNGSFEDGRRQPVSWSFGDPWGDVDARTGYEWTTSAARSGQRSVMIAHPAGHALWKFQREGATNADRYPAVPPEATSIELAVWCKADRADVQGAGGPGGPRGPGVELLTTDVRSGLNGWTRASLRCGLDWTQNVVRRPLPDAYNAVTVWLAHDGPSDATVWFDDVALAFY